MSASRGQSLIVCAHIVLALIYGWVIPPWEAHDETGHSAFINHLVLQRELPRVEAQSTVFLDQSHQPPLYYLTVAALTFWVDRSDQLQPERNVFAFDGSNRRGSRIILPDARFEHSGTVMALRAARVVSALLGGLTVFLIALAAARVFAQQPRLALLATAIAAFNPQAIFMSAIVNNDAMIALIGAALIFGAVQLIQSDAPQLTKRDLWRWAIFGALLGLALLSKRSAYGLLLFGGLLLIALAWRRHLPFSRFILIGALVFGLATIIAAPYFIRNLQLYGQLIADRSQSNPFSSAPDLGTTTEGLWVAWRDGWLPRLVSNGFRTFWGTFGWGNVRLLDWDYWLFAAFSLIGLIGLLLRLLHRQGRALWLGLMAFTFCASLLPLAQALYYQSPDLFVGRYLMPTLGPVAMLLAAGLAQIADRSLLLQREGPGVRTILPIALTAILATHALAVPIMVLRPAYYTPIIQSTNDATPVLLNFDNTVQVLSVDAEMYIANDPDGQRPYARVTLRWRALKPSPQQLAFGISILGRDNEVLGQTNIFPAKGNHPSPLWQPGDTWEDEYAVQLMKPCAKLPALGRVAVAVYPFSPSDEAAANLTRTSLPALDGEGRPTTPVIGRFRVEPWPLHYIFWQPPRGAMGHIALRDIQPALPITASPGSTINLALTYETIRASTQDGRAFVHVLAANGEPITQDDHAPLNGAYPTDLWQPGWCDTEHFTLTLPTTATGTLRVVTGFYTADGTRFTTTPTSTDQLLDLGQIVVK